LGNFNIHYLMWDENHNAHLFMRGNLDAAQHLIDIIAELDLQIVLLKGIPMLHTHIRKLHKAGQHIYSSSLTNDVIHCNTFPNDHPARTDHFLIVIHLDTWLDV